MTDEEKQKIMAIWPKAKWFIGDNAPVGLHVYKEDDPNWRGIVTGIYPGSTPYHMHNCPSCQCLSERTLAGWFEVALDEWGRDSDGAIIKSKDGPRAIALWYPPSIVKVDE